jgi:hypothetical protein
MLYLWKIVLHVRNGDKGFFETLHLKNFIREENEFAEVFPGNHQNITKMNEKKVYSPAR